MPATPERGRAIQTHGDARRTSSSSAPGAFGASVAYPWRRGARVAVLERPGSPADPPRRRAVEPGPRDPGAHAARPARVVKLAAFTDDRSAARFHLASGALKIARTERDAEVLARGRARRRCRREIDFVSVAEARSGCRSWVSAASSPSRGARRIATSSCRRSALPGGGEGGLCLPTRRPRVSTSARGVCRASDAARHDRHARRGGRRRRGRASSPARRVAAGRRRAISS
jgi:hypothetical protein